MYMNQYTLPIIYLDASVLIQEVEEQIYAISASNEKSAGFISFHDSLRSSKVLIDKAYENYQKNPQGIIGTSSGFRELDKMLGGLQESDLIILAGRPSMGKTALAINIAVEVARNIRKQGQHSNIDIKERKSVGFVSLEMSAEQLVKRIIAMECKISAHDLNTGRLEQEQFNDLSQMIQEIDDFKMFFDDTPALSISSIRTRARKLKRKHNIELLIIDYLQLIKGHTSKNRSRVEEISEITQGLKAIAKELNIPVIALSQLSRAVEMKEDKRPELSHLRESGSIEQDADIVMFMYREEYYLTRNQPPSPAELDENDIEGQKKFDAWQEKYDKAKDKAEIIIAKHRNGPVGNVFLRFDASFNKFSNFAKASSENLPL